MLLMVGNGVQGSLLGIRGTLEAFDTMQLSVVMSAYFLGFLVGSRLAPEMIRSVGHVRVFAALASLISAVLVTYPMLVEWQIWAIMRVVIGFGFAGIYITAESWLNNTATNETRGQALSLYMMVQMVGIVTSQGLLAMGDPFGYDMFLISSVLVSLSFLPILLAKTPAPTFESTARLGVRELYAISPLGCVGMLISGGIFSAMFGMAAVWGTLSLLSVSQIALFVSALYVGGLMLQYPVGYFSDRMDRRTIMLWLSAAATVVLLVPTIFILPFWAMLIVAMILGGITYPMYSLLIAYTNDFLSKEQMAAASAGLIFINGFGSIFGPLIVGWLMGVVGTRGFFLFMCVLYAIMAGYTLWRMSRRAAPSTTGGYRGVTPTASPVAAVAVLESAPEIGPSPEAPKADSNAA
ncbi:MFS transporter [Xinfangfangia sp. CPCC 101601]|uniref:MFS transporter n=2 Tax=Pseudogemmobacter lacusdianii TaxID=3069608 RepID=A0ABU0VUI2_9RHOB|nr:MFS transporter [Xinfangfangia sp. CPCC 101601]MDQ2065391.1 MFS transporter [Xinfangfangia sp. CPCC 101601]